MKELEKMASDMDQTKVSVFFWVWLPCLMYAAMIMAELTLSFDDISQFFSEGGPVEAVQFVIMVMAAFVAGWLTIRFRNLFLKICCLVLFAGSVYIAGEEVSWGQWIFGWVTPEFWAGVNDQNETNLHNTSSWLDQKPRLLLFIGMVVGGLILPLIRRWKPEILPSRFADLYPRDHLAATALFVLLPYLAQTMAELFGMGIYTRVSEMQETYMYYFILLYVLDLRKLMNRQA